MVTGGLSWDEFFGFLELKVGEVTVAIGGCRCAEKRKQTSATRNTLYLNTIPGFSQMVDVICGMYFVAVSPHAGMKQGGVSIVMQFDRTGSITVDCARFLCHSAGFQVNCLRIQTAGCVPPPHLCTIVTGTPPQSERYFPAVTQALSVGLSCVSSCSLSNPGFGFNNENS
jgi:hypothetical protein